MENLQPRPQVPRRSLHRVLEGKQEGEGAVKGIVPFFRIRAVLEELEAHLSPATGTGTGKAERKRYGDGSERLKVTARDLPVPDGLEVQILIDGSVQAQATVTRGRARIVMESPASVPSVTRGQEIEVRIGPRRLLTGVFMPE